MKDILSGVDSLVTPLEDLSLFVFCVFVCLFDYMSYHMLEFYAWISLLFFPFDICLDDLHFYLCKHRIEI